jgi:predicted porin
MKRTAIAMSLMVIAMSAHAQSSVLIYGILDEGLQYNTNSGGGHLVNLDSTVGPSGSRLGFRGYEDLGGGLGAVFALESGLNINSG